MFKALRRMMIRIIAALLIGAGLVLVPLPVTDTIIALRAAVISFAVVVYIGKTIYDTLFYSRYVP